MAPAGELVQLHFIGQAASEASIDPALATLASHCLTSAQEPGVARFDAVQVVSAQQPDPNPQFMVLESYYSFPADYDAHTASPHYATNGPKIASYTTPGPMPLRKYRTVYPAPDGFVVDTTALAAVPAAPDAAGMDGVLVDIQLAAGVDTAAFVAATIDNCAHSIAESGIARFDLLQNMEDEKNFVLVEIYADEAAPAAHKTTEHYLRWRETVADWMARPRAATKIRTVYPPRAFWAPAAK